MAGRGRGKEVERRASPRGRHRRSAHASVALIPAEGAFVDLGETLFIWRPPTTEIECASGLHAHLGGTFNSTNLTDLVSTPKSRSPGERFGYSHKTSRQWSSFADSLAPQWIPQQNVSNCSYHR